uniref:Centrosome and spindle pole-associated protein 1 n=1 Tax=Knipowitschia caucasica TaxID=637954 RepID=A0AAV2L7A7_KNICA
MSNNQRGLHFLLGTEYERKKQTLQEELQMDYKRYINQKRGLKAEDYDRSQAQGLSLPITERTSLKEKLREERSREYNLFLQERAKTSRRGQFSVASKPEEPSSLDKMHIHQVHIPGESYWPAEPSPPRKDVATLTDIVRSMKGRKRWDVSHQRQRDILLKPEDYSSSEESKDSGEKIEFSHRRKPNGQIQKSKYIKKDKDGRAKRVPADVKYDEDVFIDKNNNDQNSPALHKYDKGVLAKSNIPITTTKVFATGLLIGRSEEQDTLQKKKEQYKRELLIQMAEQRENKRMVSSVPPPFPPRVEQTYRTRHDEVKDKAERRSREREERQLSNAQMVSEMMSYNPWGRAGGGAPLRDQTGNLITDLDQMHKLNEESFRNSNLKKSSESTLQHKRVPPLSRLEQLGDRERDNLQRKISYQESLKQQIEENRQKQAEERERQKVMEEKEEKRLAKERARMLKDYEEEEQRNRTKMHIEEKNKKQKEERKRWETAERGLSECNQENKQKDKLNEERKILGSSGPSPTIPTVYDSNTHVRSPASDMNQLSFKNMEDLETAPEKHSELPPEWSQPLPGTKDKAERILLHTEKMSSLQQKDFDPLKKTLKTSMSSMAVDTKRIPTHESVEPLPAAKVEHDIYDCEEDLSRHYLVESQQRSAHRRRRDEKAAPVNPMEHFDPGSPPRSSDTIVKQKLSCRGQLPSELQWEDEEDEEDLLSRRSSHSAPETPLSVATELWLRTTSEPEPRRPGRRPRTLL